MNRTLNTEDRIIRTKIDLMHRAPFYAYILMGMRIMPAQDEGRIPTMAVNELGDLFYCDKFVQTLTDSELQFVLAHEASHVSTITIPRKGSRNLELWNVATDLVINYMLIEDGFTPPKGLLTANSQGNWVLQDEKGKQHTIQIKERFAEQVYEDLMKIIKTVQQTLGTGDSSKPYKGGFDIHIQDGKNDKGEPSNGKDENGNNYDPNGKGMSDADKKNNEEYWKSKAAQAHIAHNQQRGVGSCPSLGREMDRLLQPKINWKQVLQRFLTSTIPVDFTMRKPGKKSQGVGVYMPSIIKENMDVMIGVDVSGSIGQDEYNEFMKEVYGIACGFPQVQMKIVPWNDGVYEEDIKIVPRGNPDELFEFKPSTSGGTTMGSFGHWVDENVSGHANVCIIFTDGYVENEPYISSKCPTLIVICKNGSTTTVEKVCKNICSLADYT